MAENYSGLVLFVQSGSQNEIPEGPPLVPSSVDPVCSSRLLAREVWDEDGLIRELETLNDRIATLGEKE